MKTKQFIKNMMARAAMTLLMLIAITMAVKAQDPLGIFCETTKTFYLTCGNAEEIRHSNKFLPEGSSDTLKVTCFYSGTNITATGNTPSWKSDLTNYNTTTVVIESSFASVRPTSCAKWFNVSTFTDIQGIENLNTSEVTNMNYMFAACGISTLDLSSFNTEKVTKTVTFFCACCVKITSNWGCRTRRRRAA